MRRQLIFHEAVSSSCKVHDALLFNILTIYDSSTFIPALFSMSEIPALFAQRPIVVRHKQAAMYHPMVEALAMTLVDIPFTVMTMVFFSVIMYFVVRLQQTASQFLFALSSVLYLEQY